MSTSHTHSGQIQRSGGETALRIFYGVIMAVVAVVLALIPWPTPFAIAVVLMMLFAAREWHRMVRSPAQRAITDPRPIHIQTVATSVTVALGITAFMLGQIAIAFAFLVLGAATAFVLARQRNDNPAWHSVGVFYIGLPALALVALRVMPPHGTWDVLALFIIVWATDTGAMIFGKLIGGKKLAPSLSPGKTWAGTIGGTLTALLLFAPYAALFAANLVFALLFAAGISAVAQLGDLLESGIKRRFGYKDSGGLIPGHGGMLDRVNSLFAASVAFAILVLGLGFNPLFGVHG